MTVRSEVEEQAAEWALCRASVIYFLDRYGWVFNVHEEAWVPFRMWPAQKWALAQVHVRRLCVVLKARQLGFTWLMLGFALWLMLFHSAAVIGIFSRTEEDSQDLLDFRLKGMYDRLPGWMQARAVEADNKSRWELSNGSMAMAFATTGGRQYTFSLLLVDEADFQPDLPSLMTATKPTIDAGGRMVLLSTVDKGKPESRFKSVYRAGKTGANEWLALFLPYWARPGRSTAWYEGQKRDVLANTGSLDDLHQEYPATDTEALAARTLDKRIPPAWIEAAYREMAGLVVASAPSLPGLQVFARPRPGELFTLGVDPAEGNPTSDDSAIEVLNVATGEEAASLAGKIQPSVLASYAAVLSTFYNGAAAMVERNNHGHAVIQWLRDHSQVTVLRGSDGKPGWLSNSAGKAWLYNGAADTFRDGDAVLHDFLTQQQLASIEGSTLRAPEGLHDDRADAWALANVGRAGVHVPQPGGEEAASTVVSRAKMGELLG